MNAEVRTLPRLQVKYKNTVIPALQTRLGLKNLMQVPKLEKIVINMGVGRAVQEPKLIDEAVMCLENITGQKAVVTKSKKAISNFKLRENVSIGCKVTLRGTKMYEFLDRLISVALPRVRDFRGLPKKSFDGRGNYTLGVKENIIFMEIDRDKISKILGLDICICTTSPSNEGAMALLEELGMPFRK